MESAGAQAQLASKSNMYRVCGLEMVFHCSGSPWGEEDLITSTRDGAGAPRRKARLVTQNALHINKDFEDSEPMWDCIIGLTRPCHF